MTMPKYVLEHLIDDGTITENRVGHTARIVRCPSRCGLLVLAAIDDLGFESFCHPAPTTVAGELAAVLAGLRMHTVIAGQLVARGAHRMLAKNADEEPAFPQHQCGKAMAFPMNPIHAERQRAAFPKDTDPIPF